MTPLGSLLKYSAAVPDGKLIAGVLAASLGYAVVRYNVFGGVSADQLPVFVTNKAISVGSLVLLGVSRVVIDKPRRKHLGLIGLALALLHVMLSLLVLQPTYLAKLYLADGKMQWFGELSMLTGAIATVLLLWLAYATTTRPLPDQRPGSSLLPSVGRIVLALVAVHNLLLGASVWMNPAGWPGGLPPITLLSFVIATGLCVLPKSR